MKSHVEVERSVQVLSIKFFQIIKLHFSEMRRVNNETLIYYMGVCMVVEEIVSLKLA